MLNCPNITVISDYEGESFKKGVWHGWSIIDCLFDTSEQGRCLTVSVSRQSHVAAISLPSLTGSYSTPFSANTQPSLLWHLICQLIHCQRQLIQQLLLLTSHGLCLACFYLSTRSSLTQLFNTFLCGRYKRVKYRVVFFTGTSPKSSKYRKVNLG